ncbi:MAG: hypothetical protein ACI4D4_00270 [Lachnospira sp.]
MRFMSNFLKPYMFIIYISLIALTVLFCFTPFGFASTYNVSACAGDGIRYSTWEICRIVCIIIVDIAFVLMRRDAYNITNVLLLGDRKKIWKIDFFQTTVVSAIMSTIILFSAIVASGVMARNNWMNWESENSFAQYFVNVGLDNKNIVSLFVLSWFIYFMQMQFALLVMMISYYISNNYLWGLIFTIGIGFNDMQDWSFKLYFGRFSIMREQWLFLDFRDLFILMVLPVINAVMYFIGLYLSKRKEFYNVEVDKA